MAPYELVPYQSKILSPRGERMGDMGAVAGGDRPSKFFEIVGYSETLMLRRKIFALLLLVKIKASNFIGKSLNLGP